MSAEHLVGKKVWLVQDYRSMKAGHRGLALASTGDTVYVEWKSNWRRWVNMGLLVTRKSDIPRRALMS